MAQRLFILFLLFFSITAHAFNPKLVVFTLHGFIGDETTFCDLKEILQEDYGDDIAVNSIIYYKYTDPKLGLAQEGSIDSSDMKTFTETLYKKMREYYQKNQIDIDTPFALVTHSQGGIIGMRYVADCIYGNEFYCSGKLNGKSITPKNLKYFISMATPFWGSTAANHIKILDFIRKLLPVQQVKDLSMGSSLITYNREMSLKPLLRDNKNIFPEQTEVITISADMSKTTLGFLFKATTEKGKNHLLEHDLVVPMFSANIDYHYKVYPDDRNGYALIGRTNMGSYYYPVKGYHAEYGFLKGVACVKKNDDERYYKDSTVYLILRKHFDKFLTPKNVVDTEDLKDPSRFVTDLQTFNMEIKFNLPKKDAWFRKIYFQKKHIQPYSDDPLIVDLTRRDSLLFHKFHGFNYDHSSSDLNYVTYYHTAFFDRGYFNKEVGDDFLVKNIVPYSAEFGLEVKIPWFKTVRIAAPVSPANTTFVEYNLEPIDRKILPVVINNTTNRETVDGNQIISIQSNLFSTRVIEFNTESDRGTVKIKHLSKKNWLSELSAKNPEGFETIHNECYTATLSSNNRGRNSYYLGYNDSLPQTFNTREMQPPVNLEKFKIIGRFTKGQYDTIDQTYEEDRVLVTNHNLMNMDRHVSLSDMPSDQYLRTGYYWVNTKDVRLIEPCSTEDFLQE